jgi:hypothetical protein
VHKGRKMWGSPSSKMGKFYLLQSKSQKLIPDDSIPAVWSPGLGIPAGEPTNGCGAALAGGRSLPRIYLEARRLSRFTPRLQSVICTAVIAKRQYYCTPICLFASSNNLYYYSLQLRLQPLKYRLNFVTLTYRERRRQVNMPMIIFV